jgi:hypothetical protein
VKNLAGAMPVVSKGLIAAINAFKSGDNFTGASELMNISAALTPLVAGLSTAGGPPGMLIAAFFSVIGQILGQFAQQQESVSDKIITYLQTVEAESEYKDAQKDHTDIRLHARTMRGLVGTIEASETARKNLAYSFHTHTSDPKFEDKIKDFAEKVELLRDDIVEFKIIGKKIWRVGIWLGMEGKQHYEQWPDVLGVLCQAWADLLTAHIAVLSFVNGPVIGEAREDITKALHLDQKQTTDAVKKAIDRADNAVASLGEKAKLRFVQLKECNKEMKTILEGLAPKARDHGIFWTRGDSSFNVQIYAGDNINKPLTSIGNNIARTAVALTKSNVGRFKPQLQYFAVESSYNNNEAIRRGGPDKNTIFHAALKHPCKDLNAGGWRPLDAAPGFHSPADIWATRGDNDTACYFYTAKGNEICGYLFDPDNKRAVNSANAKDPVYRKTVKGDLISVRSVRSPQSLADDPEDAQPPSVLKGVVSIIYGGIKDASEIYVHAGVDVTALEGADVMKLARVPEAEGYVPGPEGWVTYSGVSADQHYLWVWRWDGPACATHASVIRCLAERAKGNMAAKPRWIQHRVPVALEHIEEGHGDVPKGRSAYGPGPQLATWSDSPPPPKGLFEVCACDDESLFVAIYERTADKKWALAQGDYWMVNDVLGLYTGVYDIHLGQGVMDATWTRIEANVGLRIQKLPIHCWSLFSSLTEACRASEGWA